MTGLSGIFGWFEDRWIRQPLFLGPSETLYEGMVVADATAGTNTIYGSIVPSDYIWVILNISFMDANNAPTSVVAGSFMGGSLYACCDTKVPIAGEWDSFNVYQVLFPTHKPFFRFYGCVLNDGLYARYAGFKLFTGVT